MTSLVSVRTRLPAWLLEEISQRMFDKLEFVKMTPASGWFSEKDARLSARFAGTQLHFGSPNLSAIRFFKKLFSKNRYEVSLKDAVPASYDLIWSNLELHRAIDVQEQISIWHQAIKPEGLIMFSYLGPDTAKELRQNFSIDEVVPATYVDMHDIGDALLRQGFAEPVMDMEYITLEYEDQQTLIKDAVELGFLLPHQYVSKNVQGPFQLTLEVIYGHAWAATNKKDRTDTVATIRPDQILNKKK